MKPLRNPALDLLRGFAVLTMIAANMAASFLVEPHPFAFRLYGTFAAPLFIFVSAMTAEVSRLERGRAAGYFFRRGLGLIFIAALLDMAVWKIVPFMTMDVLYLMGLAAPAVFYSARAGFRGRLLLAFLCVMIGEELRGRWGYAPVPVEVPLNTLDQLRQASSFDVLKHWLADGWFPLFPWLGISFLGAALGELRVKKTSELERRVFLWGSGLLVSGIILWLHAPGAMITREGYSELFYPPFTGFLLTAAGLCLVLYQVFSGMPDHLPARILAAFGRQALFVYVLHEILIAHVLGWFVPALPLGWFLVLYAAVTVLCYLLLPLAVRLKSLKGRTMLRLPESGKHRRT